MQPSYLENQYDLPIWKDIPNKIEKNKYYFLHLSNNATIGRMLNVTASHILDGAQVSKAVCLLTFITF